jgi:hypothetical protein
VREDAELIVEEAVEGVERAVRYDSPAVRSASVADVTCATAEAITGVDDATMSLAVSTVCSTMGFGGGGATVIERGAEAEDESVRDSFVLESNELDILADTERVPSLAVHTVERILLSPLERVNGAVPTSASSIRNDTEPSRAFSLLL